MFYFMSTISIIALATLTAASPVVKVNAGQSKLASPCLGLTKAKQTIKIGNGSPNQNFAYKQISAGIDCTNNPTGSVSITKTQTLEFSLSITSANPVEFITGGFSVSESATTGTTNQFGCQTVMNGKSGSQTGSLCVFQRIQLTGYTVNTQTCNENQCQKICTNDKGPNTIIYAPNKAQGSCFYDSYQVKLPCNALGTVHYVYNVQAGGPSSINC